MPEDNKIIFKKPGGVKFWSFAIILFVVTWIIKAPIMIVCQIIWLPIKLLLTVIGAQQREPPEKPEIEVEITECTGGQFKDEVLFIHGWPDCARLWDKQIEAFKADYRCINVTMPNYGSKPNVNSWGCDFPELTKMLAEVVETKSKTKRVTLVVHDFGSFYGYMLQQARPDLVSRIATLDIAGTFDRSFAFGFFCATYQLFNVFCFLLGEPIGGYGLRQWASSLAKHRDCSELLAQCNYSYYYMWFGKNFRSYKFDPDRCPIYYLYGAKKPFQFHSEKWLKLMKENEHKGCGFVAMKTDHWVQIQAPDKTNELILKWMKDTQEMIDKKK